MSDEERGMISRLQMRGWHARAPMLFADAYYRGEQIISNLNIAIPPELAMLRTVVGWAKIAVDPYVERLFAEGFRIHGESDVDDDLAQILEANNFAGEQSLGFVDALAMGRSWLTVGAPYEVGDAPVMCVESPLNLTAMWDVRAREPKAALQSYWLDGRRHAALWLPNQTIQLGEDDGGAWEIVNRDEHGFGRVTIHRLSHAARTNDRDGRSRITPELRSIIDATCRTLLGLEVAREFYSVPQKVILGATEESFVGADGARKSAWDAYITRILALERDEDGQLPEIHQFTPYDPSVFTKLVEMYASQAAGILASPPQDLGLYTQGNPITAEAQQVSESRRDRVTRHIQRMFSGPMVAAAQDVLRYGNGGVLPAEYERMSVDWADPRIHDEAGAADAITKYVSVGALPPQSSVTLKRAGFDAVEREQIERDRKVDAGASILAELASSIQAKEARTDLTVARDINPDAVKAQPSDSAPSGNGSQ